ncbi:TIGR04222 domain-containing membrane protein [Planctomycetaceae bacterium SH139]
MLRPLADRNHQESSNTTTDSGPSLRIRLERFDLDDSNSRLKFSERLARENNWTMRYAGRVIVEYKRFLELAITAGHTVTPSDDIDQAWHLHMVYTRSYWNDLCRDVLRQPLHHGPTKGGQHERERYEDLYARTVDSYHRTFDEAPPEDIWPASEERFRQSIQSVRVDRGKNWVIPKPAWAQVAKAGACASAPVAIVASDQMLGAAFLAVDGPSFLLIYIVLFMVALIFSVLLRSRLRPESAAAQLPPSSDQLGWAASAILVGGYNRAVMAVIARLRAAGRIRYVGNRLVSDVSTAEGLTTNLSSTFQGVTSVTPTTAPRTFTDSEEDLVILNAAEKSIGRKESGIKLDKFSKQLHAELNRISIKLEQLDLWSSASEKLSRGLTSAGPIGLLLLLGIARCAVGVTRDRPVGFLVVLLIVTGITFIAFWVSFPRRTRLGDQFIKRLQDQYPKSKRDKKEIDDLNNKGYETTPEMDAPFLMGLYGAAFMSQFAIGEDASFYNSLKSQAGNMSGGDGGAIFGGSDGGGGGGCGGGGCGGCGGCGG